MITEDKLFKKIHVQGDEIQVLTKQLIELRNINNACFFIYDMGGVIIKVHKEFFLIRGDHLMAITDPKKYDEYKEVELNKSSFQELLEILEI